MSGQRDEPRPGSAPGAGRRTPIPTHRHPALIALVAVGGGAGSIARYGVTLLLPGAAAVGGWPLATLTVNVLGTFVLGFGLEALAQLGHETPRRRAVRLAGGTGFLGGFTTYSAFALQTQVLLADGRAGLALASVLVMVALGMVSCIAGIRLGRRVGRTYLRRAPAARARAADPPETGATG